MQSHLTHQHIEIITEIQRVAKLLNLKKLSKGEFDQHSIAVSSKTVAHQFGSWDMAVKAAGLEVCPSKGGERSYKLDSTELLEEIIRVHLLLGKKPSELEFAQFGNFSITPYAKRWGTFAKAREVAYETLGQPNHA